KLWGDNARERTISGDLPNEYRIEDGKIIKSTGIFYYQSKNEVEVDGKMVTKEQDYFSTYYYDDNYFSENASKYNPSLATMSLCFELSAWGSNVGSTRDYSRKYRNAEDLLGKIGFKNFEANDYFKQKPKEDTMGVVIASKEIEVNGKEYTLIALATRGGGYEAEWAGNFTVGASGQHQGFKAASDEAHRFLEYYVNKYKSNFKSDVKLWLAGYSRGGATVNLLAGRLVDEKQIAGITIDKENLFAYCFELPMGALEDQIVPVSKYTNIHNIVNPSDLVPKVAPRAWGFTRYGMDRNVIPSVLNYSNSEDFKKMLEKFKELDTQWVHESLVKVNDDEEEYKHIIDTFQAKKFNPNFRIDFGHWEEKTGVFGLKYWEYIPNFEIEEELIINDDMTMSWFLDEFITSLALGLGDRENYTKELQGAVRLAIAEFMGGHYESYKWDKAFDIFDKKVKDNILDIAATYIWSGVPGVENLISEYLYKSASDAGIDLPAYGSIPNALTEAIKALAKTVVVSANLNGGNDLLTLLSEGNYSKLMPAHYPELCLAWMQMQDANYTPEGRELFIIDCYRILRINCPVDVSVYNSKGTLVAQFINDVPQKIKDSTIVASFTSDGEKVVFLPADEDYDIRILATGDGKLNYSVNEFSNATGAYAKIVNYYDIPIVAGDKLSGVVPRFSSEDVVNTGEGSQVKYALSTSTGELVSSKELMGKSAQDAVYTVRVESSNVEGGIIIGGGAYSEGAFAQVAAIPYEKCEFVGWYDNDTLISTDMVYRFQVKKDHSLVAKFNGNRPSPTSGTYPLKIEAGLGGSIIKGANGNYSDGSITPLNATPDSGYRFKEWISSNGGTFADKNDVGTTFTMPANETTITATFEYIAPVTPGDGGNDTTPGSGGSNTTPGSGGSNTTPGGGG
ncbi:MAG: hypothetical protein GX660_17600, partial [Clostridiaceae bacterium]|nr:hypothetical protein [Clostridiaceae bacterium]